MRIGRLNNSCCSCRAMHQQALPKQGPAEQMQHSCPFSSIWVQGFLTATLLVVQSRLLANGRKWRSSHRVHRWCGHSQPIGWPCSSSASAHWPVALCPGLRKATGGLEAAMRVWPSNPAGYWIRPAGQGRELLGCISFSFPTLLVSIPERRAIRLRSDLKKEWHTCSCTTPGICMHL